MKKSVLFKGISLVMLLAFVLSACAPAATPTAAPEPTKAPEATKAPEPTKAPEATKAPEPTKAPEATKAPEPTKAPEVKEFIFGLLMVGPYNDKGWSQAHYDAGLYVESKIPGTKMIYIDKVNSADRPGTTPAQLAEDLVSKGAKLVIFNSDDMKDSAVEFAKAHPDVAVIHPSGDNSWKDGANFVEMPKFVNIMGKMEYGKMMAGCAAALSTQTGKIGYLGPLINDETRRLTTSAFLGAKYCWTNILKKDVKDLSFKVTWIGFWFNIPGVTSDPTQVADDFINSKYDVIISGIDTTEGLIQAGKAKDAGKDVFAIPYDFVGSCQEGEKVCLGVPYFNWGPSYVKYIQAAIDGKFASAFEWNAPEWKDINNADTSPVGFAKGKSLSADASANLDKFITELAGGLNLWAGPLNYQDKTPFLKDGEAATDSQIWYLPQLLEGMEGQSVPSK